MAVESSIDACNIMVNMKEQNSSYTYCYHNDLKAYLLFRLGAKPLTKLFVILERCYEFFITINPCSYITVCKALRNKI